MFSVTVTPIVVVGYQETGDGNDSHSFLFDILDVLTVEAIKFKVTVSGLGAARNA